MPKSEITDTDTKKVEDKQNQSPDCKETIQSRKNVKTKFRPWSWKKETIQKNQAT
jgi:hypothetical protein